MKPTIERGLFFLAIAIVGLIWFASLSAPCQPIKPPSETAEKSDNAKSYCPTRFDIIGTNYIRPVAHFFSTYKDEINASSTFVIAVFTTILGVFTIRLARSTRKAADAAVVAADAADRSARAVIALELPAILAMIEGYSNSLRMDGDGPRIDYAAFGNLILTNIGGTTASPYEIQCGYFFGQELPQEPIYTVNIPVEVDQILVADQTMWYRINDFEVIFPEGDQDRLREGAIKVWYFFRILYIDFMREKREQAFCWRRYETVGGGDFIVDSTPAYNKKT